MSENADSARPGQYNLILKVESVHAADPPVLHVEMEDAEVITFDLTLRDLVYDDVLRDVCAVAPCMLQVNRYCHEHRGDRVVFFFPDAALRKVRAFLRRYRAVLSDDLGGYFELSE